jgi:RIO kinase 1
MVQLWAEKEVRNLKRLNQTNGLIKAPTPYLLKNNVIVMEFIGENGLGAPRLKDADI